MWSMLLDFVLDFYLSNKDKYQRLPCLLRFCSDYYQGHGRSNGLKAEQVSCVCPRGQVGEHFKLGEIYIYLGYHFLRKL